MREYNYQNYLKIILSDFIASTLGSLNLLIAGRGSMYLINIGSSSFENIDVSKSGALMSNGYQPNVYLKTSTSNEPIYIDNGGGLSAKAIILSQRVNITSIEAVESLPTGYTKY